MFDVKELVQFQYKKHRPMGQDTSARVVDAKGQGQKGQGQI